MWTGRNAYRPRVPHVRVHRLQRQIVVEHHDAAIATIADVHVALRVDGNRVWRVELILPVAALAAGELTDEPAVLVELDDARVHIAVRDEDVALRIPRDVGRTAEAVPPIQRRRILRVLRRGRAGNRLGPAAEHHHDTALRIELDHHVRAFVDDPYVVVAIDANLVRELDAVHPDAPFLHERAVRVELEQAGVATPVIDENVA